MKAVLTLDNGEKFIADIYPLQGKKQHKEIAHVVHSLICLLDIVLIITSILLTLILARQLVDVKNLKRIINYEYNHTNVAAICRRRHHSDSCPFIFYCRVNVYNCIVS